MSFEVRRPHGPSMCRDRMGHRGVMPEAIGGWELVLPLGHRVVVPKRSSEIGRGVREHVMGGAAGALSSQNVRRKGAKQEVAGLRPGLLGQENESVRLQLPRTALARGVSGEAQKSLLMLQFAAGG